MHGSELKCFITFSTFYLEFKYACILTRKETILRKFSLATHVQFWSASFLSVKCHLLFKHVETDFFRFEVEQPSASCLYLRKIARMQEICRCQLYYGLMLVWCRGVMQKCIVIDNKKGWLQFSNNGFSSLSREITKRVIAYFRSGTHMMIRKSPALIMIRLLDRQKHSNFTQFWHLGTNMLTDVIPYIHIDLRYHEGSLKGSDLGMYGNSLHVLD